MKRRPSLLKKIWRKLVSPKPATAAKKQTPVRKVISSLEPLEGRISPAALINSSTLIYKDLDGDMVTVKFTKAIFTSATPATNLANANAVFGFSTGAGAVNGTTTTPEQLLAIDLTMAPSVGATKLASGTGISVTAVKTGAGNGFVDVGYINGTGLPLGAVTVSGDLGQIDAGGITSVTGLASLKVKTLGFRDPTQTQPVTGRSLVSNITGGLGSLTVTGDVTTASVLVVNSALGAGKIGAVTIGGSLKGAAGDDTGLINAATDIGLVKIGTLATDGIVGAAGKNSGRVHAGGKIAGLTVSGIITGAGGIASGTADADGTLGTVTLLHSLTGGAGAGSGSITGAGIGALMIGGSIVGGGTDSGSGVVLSTGSIGAVKVSGSIDGTTGVAGVRATGSIGAVTIIGDLKGGGTTASGILTSGGDIGAINVHAIAGGAGLNSGAIAATGKISGLTVGAGITGSTGNGSGTVHATGTINALNVKGSLTGGAGTDSGSILGAGIGAVNVGGSIFGGNGAGSGVIVSTKTIAAVKVAGSIDGTTGTAATAIRVAGIRAAGNIGPVTIVGDLKGGPQRLSGFIDGGADIGAITVNAITGGAGQSSASITAVGKISTATLTGILGVTVKGDVTGGTGAGSGSIFTGTDFSRIGDLGSVKIGGKLVGNTGDSSGTISSGGKLASVTIGPAVPPATQLAVVKGGAGNFSGSILSHGAMGPVKITGHVEGGAGNSSGSILSLDLITATSESAGDLGTVTITGHLQGGGGDDSGEVRADGKLAGVITGGLLGSTGDRSGSIRGGQGTVHAGVAGALTVKGVLTGGAGAQSGSIICEGKIASVLVTGATNGGAIRAGDDIGSVTFNSDVFGTGVSARGKAVQSATSDLAIGKITVLGDVSFSRFRAGYDTDVVPQNPDAQIGAVFVKGDWTGADLIAGVLDGGAAGFGTSGDGKISGPDSVKIVSSIASIVIGGQVIGTPGNAVDHFGFTAQKIGTFSANKVPHLFNAAITDPPFEILASTSNDVTVREVPL